MVLFEKMNEKNLERDIVAYMNGVRSAGFCRPWTYTLELLNTAFSEFENKNDILPVVSTVITNLKYFERGLARGDIVMGRSSEVLRWMEAKDISPNNQIMVRVRVFVCCVLCLGAFVTVFVNVVCVLLLCMCVCVCCVCCVYVLLCVVCVYVCCCVCALCFDVLRC
jgi:hypothetical protein